MADQGAIARPNPRACPVDYAALRLDNARVEVNQTCLAGDAMGVVAGGAGSNRTSLPEVAIVHEPSSGIEGRSIVTLVTERIEGCAFEHVVREIVAPLQEGGEG